MEKINTTKPHYVRCLKSNDELKPSIFERLRVTEQLKYGGVLEAVRVARAGFPMRMSLEGFYDHYKCVANPFNPITATLPPRLSPGDLKTVEQLKIALWDDTSKPNPSDRLAKKKSIVAEIWRGKTSTNSVHVQQVQLGKTKVFMRRPPYDLLEGRRARYNYLFASRIQRIIRGIVTRRWYKSAKWAIVFMQRWVRNVKLRMEIRKRINKKRAKGIKAPVYVAPPPKVKVVEVAPVDVEPSKPAGSKDKVGYVPPESKRNRAHSRDFDYEVKHRKPAVVVSRKILTREKKSDEHVDDELYYWLFGKNATRSMTANAKRITRREPEELIAKPTIVIKAPPIKSAPAHIHATAPVTNNMFAKPHTKSVEIGTNYHVTTGKSRKSNLGTFKKKNGTKEDEEQYKKQFPSVWSNKALTRFFSS